MTRDFINMSIDLVDDSYVLEAQTAKTNNKHDFKVKKYKLFGTIAGCLCIICALIIISLFMGERQQNNGQNISVVLETNTPAANNRVIITGKPGGDDGYRMVSPGVFVSHDLLKHLENPQNEGALFNAVIKVCPDSYAFFTYEGKSVNEWYDNPAITAYNEAYDEWYNNIYRELDREMAKREENGDPDAQGWWKHDVQQVFYEYWALRQSGETLAEYNNANTNFLKAKSACIMWQQSSEHITLCAQLDQQEADRLITLGFDIWISGNRLQGHLSKQQIMEFPTVENITYYIVWPEPECDSMENIVASMSDMEKIQICVTLKAYTWDEMNADFKSVYPKEHEILTIEDLRGDSLCPNPEEVESAIELRKIFHLEVLYKRQEAFLKKYNISDENLIMPFGGEYFQLMVDKATIIKMLQDKDIAKIHPLIFRGHDD